MPVIGNILVCPACGYKHDQINLVNCLNCGHDLGAPNVNMASTDDEINALQKRYDNAEKYLSSNGLKTILNSFENFFNANVKAIINTDLKTLDNWINNYGSYNSYYRTVDDGLRTIAKFTDDQKRSVYDGVLFGKYSWDIIYAALTLSDEGLISYGKCRIILNESSISSRASTLEENLYTFVIKHNILGKLSLTIPLGYRSTWDKKLRLAVAKLYLKLNPALTQNDYPEIVLRSDGNRVNDEFIEVHIYKEITILAAKEIIIPIPKNKKDEITVKKIEGKLPGKVTRV